jgi:hypothetical protein
MRINVAIPESHVNAHVLNAALEPVTRLNEAMIRAGEVPSFDRALKNGWVQWRPEPPGGEHFDHAKVVIGRRWGDCDDLAPWHAGALRASGADPGAKAIVKKSGPHTWHAVVLRSDGMIEDPSARAGMPRAGQRVAQGATLPRMSPLPPRGSSVVGGHDVGAYVYRPEIAIRKVYDHAYQARVDVPWFSKKHGKPDPTEIAMATLHAAPLAATALTGAIDGAVQVACLGGYGHPEHIDRLCAIADRVSGQTTARRLAQIYGAGHARAAEQYTRDLVQGIAAIEHASQLIGQKKKSASVSVPAALVPRETDDVEGSAELAAICGFDPGDWPQVPIAGMSCDGHVVGGFFDSLARVAMAVGTGGASEVVHAASPAARKAMDNAVKAAGRAIGKAGDALVTLEHSISKEIAKIPYVGGVLAMFFDAGFHIACGPMLATIDIVIKGKRIDTVLVAQFKTALQDFKNVGPYVQMIISVVPGWGTAVSAAIGMGLALANGQPIDQAILAGVTSMLPGGPLAKAAVNMAYSGIHAAITHEKLNISSLGNMAMGAAADALNLPAAAKNAIMAGVGAVGQICSGVPIDKAITHGVIDALPIPSQAKQALNEADAIALDLAHGKRFDKALLGHVGELAKFLPVDAKLQAQIANVATTGISLAEGVPPEKALMHALQSGAADALIAIGGKALPAGVQDVLNKGMAVGTGVVQQARRVEQIMGSQFQGKILDLGKALAAQTPAVDAARKLVASGELRGFDLGSGLLSQKAELFDVSSLRNGLKDLERKGFDTAMALRSGLVAHPVPTHLDPLAQAGHAIALGLAPQTPANRAAITATISANPFARSGVQAALQLKICAARTPAEFRAACMHETQR